MLTICAILLGAVVLFAIGGYVCQRVARYFGSMD